jgi:hypothetical protein
MHHQLVGCRIGLIDDETAFLCLPKRIYDRPGFCAAAYTSEHFKGKRDTSQGYTMVQMPRAAVPAISARGPILATE